MAKYRVAARSVDYVYIDVEAGSADEAKEFAREYVDGGCFHQDGGDWEMGGVCELDDDACVDYSYEDVKEIMED